MSVGAVIAARAGTGLRQSAASATATVIAPVVRRDRVTVSTTSAPRAGVRGLNVTFALAR